MVLLTVLASSFVSFHAYPLATQSSITALHLASNFGSRRRRFFKRLSQ